MGSLREDIRRHAGSYPQYTSIREMLMDIVQRVKKSQPNETYYRHGVAVDADTYYHNLLGLNNRTARESKPVQYAPSRPLAKGESRIVPILVSEEALRDLRSEYEGKAGWKSGPAQKENFHGFKAIDPFASLDASAIKH